MLLSIIVPVYNDELNIKFCLESILSQNIQDYEIICVDDGSSDDSFEILEFYAQQYEQIKIFKQKNGGPGKARNKALQEARGEYICFIDSDDIFKPNALQILLKKQILSDADIVVGLTEYVDAKTQICTKIKGWQNYEQDKIYKIDKFFYKSMFQNISSSACSKLYRRNVIVNNNINFSNYKAAEDFLFVFKYILNATTILFIDSSIIQYNVNQNNRLSSKNSLSLFDFNLAYIELYEFLIKKDLYRFLKRGFFISWIYCIIYVLKRCSVINKFKIIQTVFNTVWRFIFEKN